MTEIGEGAFQYCDSLRNITIPASVTSIGEGAFKDTAYYKNSANWVNGILYIGDYLIEARTTISGECNIREGTKLIANGAFKNCSSLTSIAIPESVTLIGRGAFQDCSSMRNATFEEASQLTSIVCDTFSGCSSLESIAVPRGVIFIENFAFTDCSSLTNVTFPASVTSIGSNAFSGCSKLESIEVATENQNYSSQDGILYNKEKTKFIWIPNAVKGVVTIPEGVTSIRDYAFNGRSSLTSIVIPASVTEIGREAFENCSLLTSVTIPEGVTSIGWGAFYDCKSLTSITIPARVTYIGCYAFSSCSSLEKVYYGGTKADWENIDIYYFSDDLLEIVDHRLLTDATYFFSDGTPSEEQWTEWDYWWHFDAETGEVVEWEKENQ